MAEATARMTARHRTLGLEVRPAGFGFVLVEGVSTLLDWGIRRRRHAQTLYKYFKPIVQLIAAYDPNNVVVGTPRTLQDPGVRQLVYLLRAEAQRSSIKVSLIGRREIRSFFR